MNDNRSNNTRFIVGSVFIVVGLLLFMSINEVLNFHVGNIVFSFPFFMFVAGLLILANSKNRTLGIIITMIGGFFLLPRVFPWLNLDGDLIFPLIIIGIGITIIVKQRKPVKIPVHYNNIGPEVDVRKDFIDDVAVFGGGTKIISTNNFRGGNITAIFGGSEIDLTGCKLAEGENFLDVLMIFGGSDIRVPKEWDIIINVTPLFGGFSNKVIRDPALPIDSSRRLIIKGVALFGGGEVKNSF